MGLNDIYQPIRGNILARDPLPDVKDALLPHIGRNLIGYFILVLYLVVKFNVLHLLLKPVILKIEITITLEVLILIFYIKIVV